MSVFLRFVFNRKNRIFRLLAVCVPLLLVLALLCQVVFATTYVITDGTKVFTHTSFTADPAAVLDAVGVSLGAADRYTIGGDGITVRRAQTVTVVYHGREQTVCTEGETVAALLARLKLTVADGDRLSHRPDDATYHGMVLRVDSVVARTETYAVCVARDTICCVSDSLPAGAEEIVAEGTDGELLCVAEMTYTNGAETARTVLSETVTRPVSSRIIAVGTAEPAAPNAQPVISDGYITLATGEVLTYTDTMQVEATAYTHTDEGCGRVTYTGTTVRVGTVAVDPRVIPYGTRMFIVASDGSYVYGIAEAEDCGGDIKGSRVDLYMPTYEDCIAFGRRACTVYLLGSGT